MRKIIVSMHVSLDGFVAGLEGEMDWIKVDEEMFDFVKRFTDEADVALYGRKTWEMMDSYWPMAGEAPNASKHDKEHSLWYNSVDKVVVSNTMIGQEKEKTIFVGGDVIQQLEELKNKDGKDILIFGSPSVVRTLMEKNLIDDYWLFVNPVILGQGISMYAKMNKRIELKHQTTKDFSSGVVANTVTLI
ncbi:dihydrofolate reductase family protein [Candidatus Peregrinibacteria bacterium]|nr:dihydrofolate reductase family protein [Candidatus Peregrinibacteria bacterium]